MGVGGRGWQQGGQGREYWAGREQPVCPSPHTRHPKTHQDRRFGQMEDALAAREAKRDAYLVHRLEATAAQKIQEHRKWVQCWVGWVH